MSIAAKCTCGDSLYYCTGGKNCNNGNKDGVVLMASNDEGQGKYNELWTEVIAKVESDNVSCGAYSDTIAWLQERFNITRKK